MASAAESALQHATSTLPSVAGDLISAAAGAFNTATSELTGVVGYETSAIAGAAAAAATDAAKDINRLIGAGVRTHVAGGALSLGVCVGIAMVLL